MKLWAISDLHVGYEENRRAVDALPAHPDDWLLLGGDTGETLAHLDFVLRTLQPRFAQLRSCRPLRCSITRSVRRR